MSPVQKFLIGLGISLIIVGFLWPLFSKIGFGKLPGDIAIRKDGFSFYFPITTMILISIIVTIIARLFR